MRITLLSIFLVSLAGSFIPSNAAGQAASYYRLHKFEPTNNNLRLTAKAPTFPEVSLHGLSHPFYSKCWNNSANDISETGDVVYTYNNLPFVADLRALRGYLVVSKELPAEDDHGISYPPEKPTCSERCGCEGGDCPPCPIDPTQCQRDCGGQGPCIDGVCRQSGNRCGPLMYCQKGTCVNGTCPQDNDTPCRPCELIECHPEECMDGSACQDGRCANGQDCDMKYCPNGEICREGRCGSSSTPCQECDERPCETEGARTKRKENYKGRACGITEDGSIIAGNFRHRLDSETSITVAAAWHNTKAKDFPLLFWRRDLTPGLLIATHKLNPTESSEPYFGGYVEGATGATFRSHP